jgi:hypothetical protein
VAARFTEWVQVPLSLAVGQKFATAAGRALQGDDPEQGEAQSGNSKRRRVMTHQDPVTGALAIQQRRFPTPRNAVAAEMADVKAALGVHEYPRKERPRATQGWTVNTAAAPRANACPGPAGGASGAAEGCRTHASQKIGCTHSRCRQCCAIHQEAMQESGSPEPCALEEHTAVEVFTDNGDCLHFPHTHTHTTHTHTHTAVSGGIYAWRRYALIDMLKVDQEKPLDSPERMFHPVPGVSNFRDTDFTDGGDKKSPYSATYCYLRLEVPVHTHTVHCPAP